MITSADTPHVAGRPFGRPVGDGVAQFVEPQCVCGDPRVVGEAVADDDVHHRQHHRDVGAGQRLDEPVARSMSIASAVTVRIGSMTTSRAPCARARSIVGQRCRLVSLVLVPHRMISSSVRVRAGRVPRPTPFVIAIAAPTVGAADRPRQLRRAHVPEEPAAQSHHRQQALVAGVGEGQHRFGAVLVDHAWRLVAISASASSQLICSNSPEPFGPDRRSGCSTRSGLYTRSRNRLTFGHSSPGGVGMIGVAAQLDGHRRRVGSGVGRSVVDGDGPSARVGTVVVAGAVDGWWPRGPVVVAIAEA